MPGRVHEPEQPVVLRQTGQLGENVVNQRIHVIRVRRPFMPGAPRPVHGLAGTVGPIAPPVADNRVERQLAGPVLELAARHLPQHFNRRVHRVGRHVVREHAQRVEDTLRVRRVEHDLRTVHMFDERPEVGGFRFRVQKPARNARDAFRMLRILGEFVRRVEERPLGGDMERGTGVVGGEEPVDEEHAVR